MKLSKLQKIVLIIYLLISGILYFLYSNKMLARNDMNMLIFFYGFGTSLGLLVAYMKELRNNFNFILWTIIGLIQYWIYSINKKDLYFNMRDYSKADNWVSFESKVSALSTDTFKSVIVVLISIKLFDWIFKKITGLNLIGTYYRFSWYDDSDKRRITWLDVLFNVILYTITLTAVFIKF